MIESRIMAFSARCRPRELTHDCRHYLRRARPIGSIALQVIRSAVVAVPCGKYLRSDQGPMERQSFELQRFKTFYSDFKAADLALLDAFYAPEVMFRDPVHERRGLAALRRYFAASREPLTECRFEFTDTLADTDDPTLRKYCLRWHMHYRHPRLKGGGRLVLEGASVLHVREKILFHEDFYDMGAMLYEHLPLLGGTVRWLKRRVAGDGQ
jgi:hypothetical protein